METRKTSSLFIVLLGIMLLQNTSLQAQQESQYTQYLFNPVVINPAYAGYRRLISVFGLYRNQWVGIEGAPQTFNLSVDAPVGKSRVGLGLDFIDDKIGASDNISATVDFSYTLPVNRKTSLAFGVKAGFNYLNLDPTKLHIYDPNVDLDLTNHTAPMVGLGFYLYGERWFLGASTPNFLETKHYHGVQVSTATEKMHFYVMGGYVFDFSRSVALKPAGLIKAVVGAPVSIDVSANVSILEKMDFGVSYRWDAAVSAMAGFQLTEGIFVGYAYDYPTTTLAHFNTGSHEIFMRFDIFAPDQTWGQPSLF